MILLVFLLLAQTGCDWVEISQNHYRKPHGQVTVGINSEENTESTVVYKNYSSPAKPWQKGIIDRVSSVANIRRVYVPSVKTPSMQVETNIFNREAGIYINAPERRYDSVKPNVLSKYHEEEIPIDPTKRIEASHHINRGYALGKNSETRNLHKAHIATQKKITNIESVNEAYITNIKKGNLDQDMESLKSTYIKDSENRDITTTEKTFQIKYEAESNVDFLVMKEELLQKDKAFSKIAKATEIAPSLPINNPVADITESFIKATEKDSIDVTGEVHMTHFKNQNESDKKKESIKYERNESETITSDGISNHTKGSTMNIMWKLIKVVTDSIYKSTRKSFKNKINYLEGLKSNILSSIEDQVERTWPDDTARSSRRAREAGMRGHVEFPSSESALMSISFLTFAVFLIKLVLQVIHTYKNKTMMVTPAVVTAVGRAAAAIKSKTQQ